MVSLERVEMWPKDTSIHVSSEEQGRELINFLEQYGYSRSDAHAAYKFGDYPYLVTLNMIYREDDRYLITGYSQKEAVERKSWEIIEFDEWWDQVNPSEFEPAESLDMLFT